MAEPNLESLIKDLYNHARQGLSEDLVAALLETAKKLPTTNEQLLAVRLSGLVTRELLTNPKHPAPELLNLARFIKREEAKYRGTAVSAIMFGELFKMLWFTMESKYFLYAPKEILNEETKKAIPFRIAFWYLDLFSDDLFG